MSYGDDFVLTLFTNDPDLARRADSAGIDRIGLDLEVLNKKKRQDPGKAWISDHRISALPSIRQALRNGRLFARSNPINPRLSDEIEQLLDHGVETLMLPMFRTARDADQYVEMVAGRAEVSLLVETMDAAQNIEEIVRVEGIDEVHVGLNDLHLSLGLGNQFELLISPLLERISACVIGAGIPFGFGGVGRVNDPSLPVPSKVIYPHYPRLRADRALVARVFVTPGDEAVDLAAEVRAFRAEMTRLNEKPYEELNREKESLAATISELKNRHRSSQPMPHSE